MEKSRYIKTVNITYNDVQKNKVDTIVNGVAELIKQNGGKIVSYMHEVIGVGFATVYLVYTIVYERENEIPQEVFGKKKSSGKKAGASEND